MECAYADLRYLYIDPCTSFRKKIPGILPLVFGALFHAAVFQLFADAADRAFAEFGSAGEIHGETICGVLCPAGIYYKLHIRELNIVCRQYGMGSHHPGIECRYPLYGHIHQLRNPVLLPRPLSGQAIASEISDRYL